MTQPMSHLGFTLIELMVTLSIAVILATVAIPGFQDFFRNNRLATQSNDFVAAFNLARSEAMRRGVRVTVCKSDNPTATPPACNAAAAWHQGWVVFVDAQDGQNGRPGATGVINAVHTSSDTPPVVTPADPVVRVFVPSTTNFTLTAGANVANWVTFLPSGLYRGNGGACAASDHANCTFTLCSAGVSRQIRFSAAGRMTITPGAC